EGEAVSALIDSASLPVKFTPDSRQAWVRLAVALLIGALGSVGMWSVAVSLAFTAVMLGFGIGGVLTGRLCDRFGIVAAVGIGAVGTAIGYVSAGLSP